MSSRTAKRREIDFQDLRRMLPQQIDCLPMPVQFGAGPDGGVRVLAGAAGPRRMRWVGFGWVDEGLADGSEPTLVTEREQPAVKRVAR